MADLGQGTFLAFVLGGGLDFNFAVEEVVIDNGLGFDSLASVLGLDVYVHNEKLKIKSGEVIRTWTFGLTSARAAATSAAPCF